MTDEQTSFHAEIVDHAKRNGFAPTPDQIEAANAVLNSRLLRFSTGLTFIDGAPGDISPAFDHACQFFSKVSAPPAEGVAPAPLPPPPTPVAAPMVPPPPPPAVRDPVSPEGRRVPMSLETAAGLVRSAAQSGGFSLTPEGEASAAAHLAPLLTFDGEAGTYVYVEPTTETTKIEDGQLIDLPLGTFAISVAQRYGTMKKAADTPSGKAEPTPAQVRTDPMGQLGRAIEAGQAAAAKAGTDQFVADILATGRNPWKTGNRTHQAAIRSRMPALADKMQAEADPYR